MNRLLSLLTLAAATTGFSSASVAQEPTGPLTMNQWVQIAEDGKLTGTVVVAGPSDSVEAVPSAVVVLAGKQGESYRTVADDSGNFSVPDVEEGIYSLTARGEDTFAIHALHIVDRDQAGAETLPTDAEVVSARIGHSTIKAATLRYLPARLEQASVDLEAIQLEQFAEEVRERTNLRIRQVDGGLQGLIRMAGAVGGELQGADDMNVFVFSDQVEVERAVTSDGGWFRVESLPIGQYTAVTVGPAGMAVVGFELLPPAADDITAAPDDAADDSTFVAATQAGGQGDYLVIQAAPLPTVNEVASGQAGPAEEIPPGEPIMDEAVAAPSGGGGFAGGGGFGGGGGGGGGFGGGGFGGIAALAGVGIAAAIVAADDDDDDIIVPPPPASPVIP